MGILNFGKNFLVNLEIKIFFVKIGFNFVNLLYIKKILNFFLMNKNIFLIEILLFL